MIVSHISYSNSCHEFLKQFRSTSSRYFVKRRLIKLKLLKQLSLAISFSKIFEYFPKCNLQQPTRLLSVYQSVNVNTNQY